MNGIIAYNIARRNAHVLLGLCPHILPHVRSLSFHPQLCRCRLPKFLINQRKAFCNKSGNGIVKKRSVMRRQGIICVAAQGFLKTLRCLSIACKPAKNHTALGVKVR